ncbi:MAG: radical SAM protein [Chloroflexi bacterium]|nr:radical SAM protein [Chloroflexota bacterium]
MKKQYLHKAHIDEMGRLIIPQDLVSRFGYKPDSDVYIEEGNDEIRLHRPVSHLAKVYIEVTNLCNLDCQTCMRNVWGEPSGMMSDATFEKIFAEIQGMSVLPTVFFGGYGEPLIHPKTAEWVTRFKEIGARVELISNGLLLTEERSLQFIRAGLDVLWISLDGSSEESYVDIRLGSSLPVVIDNLKKLRYIRHKATDIDNSLPNLGIAFVAMKKNISDLSEVLKLGVQLGANRFSISNVLPHTPELNDQILYKRSIQNMVGRQNTSYPLVNLSRMDWNDVTKDVLAYIYGRKFRLELAGYETNRAVDTCPFVEQGSMSIRWDGSVSPCLPLLHTNQYVCRMQLRKTLNYSLGNINDIGVLGIWQSEKYAALSDRLQRFDFSPCTFCDGCELSEENLTDCLGNTELACGGCLWAQGFIRCP